MFYDVPVLFCVLILRNHSIFIADTVWKLSARIVRRLLCSGCAVLIHGAILGWEGRMTISVLGY